MMAANFVGLMAELDADMKIEATNQKDFLAFVNEIAVNHNWELPLSVEVKAKRGRTLSQNAAIHKYLAELSQALNDAGLDQRKVLKHDAEIPWHMESAKDNLWRPIQKAVTGVESTTELTTAQVSEVYQVLDRHLGSKTGVSIPFPSMESLSEAQR